MRIIAALTAICFANPSLGQETVADDTQLLSRLLDTECIDVMPSSGCERIILLRSATHSDTADLIILSPNNAADPDQTLIIRDMVYSGHLMGSFPYIDYRDTGRFALRSEQTGHGPHPWMQDLTIARHDGALVVTDYEFYSYDRTQNDVFSCEINFLTGEFSSEAVLFDPESERETIHWRSDFGPAVHMPIADWPTAQGRITHCTPEADLYYNH